MWFILTLPITPEPIHISEQMVNDMQSEYKSHFPKMAALRKQASTCGNNATSDATVESSNWKYSAADNLLKDNKQE